MNMPKQIDIILSKFIEETKNIFVDDLVSIVLFGSAAEDEFRQTSDVNMMIVLKDFTLENVKEIRESFRTAHIAIQLNARFILKSEIALAAESFAVKFLDMASRHRILYGINPSYKKYTLPSSLIAFTNLLYFHCFTNSTLHLDSSTPIVIRLK